VYNVLHFILNKSNLI